MRMPRGLVALLIGLEIRDESRFRSSGARPLRFSTRSAGSPQALTRPDCVPLRCQPPRFVGGGSQTVPSGGGCRTGWEAVRNGCRAAGVAAPGGRRFANGAERRGLPHRLPTTGLPRPSRPSQLRPSPSLSSLRSSHPQAFPASPLRPIAPSSLAALPRPSQPSSPWDHQRKWEKVHSVFTLPRRADYGILSGSGLLPKATFGRGEAVQPPYGPAVLDGTRARTLLPTPFTRGIDEILPSGGSGRIRHPFVLHPPRIASVGPSFTRLPSGSPGYPDGPSGVRRSPSPLPGLPGQRMPRPGLLPHGDPVRELDAGPEGRGRSSPHHLPGHGIRRTVL